VRQGFGICRPICDEAACADPDESCVAGELVGALADVCVDVPPAVGYGDPCAIDEFELGDPCGERGVCALPDPESPPTCVEAAG